MYHNSSFFPPNYFGDLGYHSASASISGNGVYQRMKFEGGVHRVQRVPATESKGRLHTSTVTVAILPQPDEVNCIFTDIEDICFCTVKDQNLFHRVDTIGNIFTSGAATSENISDVVHEMK